MKIYNKRSFISGTISFLLGLALLLCCIFKTFDLKSILLIIIMFFFGWLELRRSMSGPMSKEDRIMELDERNRLIRLKSKSKAFNVTQTVCFVLMLVFMILGSTLKEIILTYAGVGLAFGFNISMFAEIISCIYYEKHT